MLLSVFSIFAPLQPQKTTFAAVLCSIFLFRLFLNRKHFGNFGFFSIFAETFYLFTFYPFAFSLILDNLQKTETETKKPRFCRFLPQYVRFCRKQNADFQ